ncbi:MAG: ankyrin repeat domain-containing protein [Bacteriovorax sp.]
MSKKWLLLTAVQALCIPLSYGMNYPMNTFSNPVDLKFCTAIVNQNLADVESSLKDGANPDVFCQRRISGAALAMEYDGYAPTEISRNIVNKIVESNSNGELVSTNYGYGNVKYAWHLSNLAFAYKTLNLFAIKTYLDRGADPNIAFAQSPFALMAARKTRTFDPALGEAYDLLVQHGLVEFDPKLKIDRLADMLKIGGNLQLTDQFLINKIKTWAYYSSSDLSIDDYFSIFLSQGRGDSRAVINAFFEMGATPTLKGLSNANRGSAMIEFAISALPNYTDLTSTDRDYLNYLFDMVPAGYNFNRNDSQLLRTAAAKLPFEYVKKIIDAGGNSNARSFAPNGQNDIFATPLLSASFAGRYDVAKYLIEKGADVNLANSVNYYPLICAVTYGPLTPDRYSLVELLLQKGADPNDKRWSGQTIYYNAGWSPDLQKLLVKYGGRPQ